MMTFFLNCGMRLAELVTMNLGDFRDDTIRITGKGGKETARITSTKPAWTRCSTICRRALHCRT